MKIAVILASLFYGVFAATPEPPCDDLKVEVEVTHTSEGLNNGMIRLNAEGGAKPYTYIFLDEDFNPITTKTTEPEIKKLSRGKVKFIVRDENDCFQSKDIIIK